MAILSVPSIKEIWDLIKKGSTIEAQEKIMELREAAVRLQEENQTLREQVKELEEALSVRKSLVWEPPSYWVKSADRKDGPYCQVCYDKERKLVRLQTFGTGWKCLACKAEYDVRPVSLSRD